MIWLDQLSTVPRQWYEFLKLRPRGNNHTMVNVGAVGNLVDEMSNLLDKESGSTAPPGIKLDVPYHSQWEDDAGLARRDCGPACVEMVGKYMNPSADVSTDDIMRFITGGSDRATSISELQRASSELFGVTLRRVDGASPGPLGSCLVGCRPVIVLVHYGSFQMRMDRNYTAGHWMVVVGLDEIDYQGEKIERVLLHDPDWWGDYKAQGAFIPVETNHFLRMWGDCVKDGNPAFLALVPAVEAE